MSGSFIAIRRAAALAHISTRQREGLTGPGKNVSGGPLVFCRPIRFHSCPVIPRIAAISMRLSRYFLPILRDTPKEAEIVSHRLMLRAGMIRQQAAGIYSFFNEVILYSTGTGFTKRPVFPCIALIVCIAINIQFVARVPRLRHSICCRSSAPAPPAPR